MIVGAILTQNTAWSNVEKALINLRRARCLHYSAMQKASAAHLAALIRPAGYFNIKAKRLKNFLNYVARFYQGRLSALLALPLKELRGELLKISGVGPETADSIVLYAAGLPSFVVDAYTHRVFIRLGILKGKETYDEVRDLFMAHLPPNAALYNEYHALIVAHAKRHCLARSPKCGLCPLGRNCRFNPFKP